MLTVAGTGGGKTLMYLLPAVLASAPSLVISPIKSLVNDTFQRCLDLGIIACVFTGEVSQDIKDEKLSKLSSYKVILTTPERLAAGESLKVTIDTMISLNQLERLVFDEAHAISTRGNTFKPVYKEVCESLSQATCPKLLLSATIPRRVESSRSSLNFW